MSVTLHIRKRFSKQ
uniref:Uncharacterized protein n=1 Tax=Rhizophora mucronata TaxID=61149 RepID=A0A2P2NPZ6_RHIMU